MVYNYSYNEKGENYMDTKEIKLDNGRILTPVEYPKEQMRKLSEIVNSPEYQNYAASQIQKQLYENLGLNKPIQPPKNLMVEEQKQTNELIEFTNEQILELQNQLKETTEKLAESNSKIAEQNIQISDLKEQLNETNIDKAKHKISDIIVGALGGVLTAVIIYFIAKIFGISL